MTDLGFGLVDRRSVLIVLFTLGISHIILGNPMPIDSTNAVTAFLGFLILTGFIYAIRSVFRVALTGCYTIVRIPYDLLQEYAKRNVRGLKGNLNTIYSSLSISFRHGFIYPSFAVRDWQFKQPHPYYGDSYINRKYGLLGVIDRIMLIAIAWATTIPLLTNTIKIIGLIGIMLLVLVYILTGKFTFILEDAIHKADNQRERQHQEMVSAAANPNISFPSVIETRPHSTWDP